MLRHNSDGQTKNGKANLVDAESYKKPASHGGCFLKLTKSTSYTPWHVSERLLEGLTAFTICEADNSTKSLLTGNGSAIHVVGSLLEKKNDFRAAENN